MHELLPFAIMLERGFTTQSATGSGKSWAESCRDFTRSPFGLIPPGGLALVFSQNKTRGKQGQCWRLSPGWQGRQRHVGRLVADAAAKH